MKTLIINGSPRKNGDTYALITEFKKHLVGDIIEISAYYDNIKPCMDCRQCWKKKGCVIEDDMSKVYNDDYDVVVIASPIYMSTLTGPLVSLASRFQAYYTAKYFLGDEIMITDKDAVLILAGGGDGGPEQAIRIAKWMFKQMNANLDDVNIAASLHTNDLPAKDDIDTLIKMKEIAYRINKKYYMDIP